MRSQAHNDLGARLASLLEERSGINDRSGYLDRVVYFAGWSPNGLGKMVLGKLVMLGVPFIYWPHSEDEPDAEQDLTQIVKGLETLSAMPDAIRKKRLAEVISSGSLLWDDASFNPYGG